MTIAGGKWRLNDKATYAGAKGEGLLMNVRMVNAVFEDANDMTRPQGFDPETKRFCTPPRKRLPCSTRVVTDPGRYLIDRSSAHV